MNDPSIIQSGGLNAPLWAGDPPAEVMQALAEMPKCLNSVIWIAQGRLHTLFCEQAEKHMGMHWGMWQAESIDHDKQRSKVNVKVTWGQFKEE